MGFMNEIYHFNKIFRDIEKATKKCVHLNGAIEYIYIYLSQLDSSVVHLLIILYLACLTEALM